MSENCGHAVTITIEMDVNLTRAEHTLQLMKVTMT